MEDKMKKLIGCCGLDCEKCDARIATLNNDNELREKTAALWASLNNAPITPEMINCEGCRVDGVKTPFCQSFCRIKSCVREKSFETCGDCPDYKQCETLGALTANAPEALDNLASLQS